MGTAEIQQIIDDLDSARYYVPDEMKASIVAASNILTQLPDEVVGLLEASQLSVTVKERE